MIPWSLPTHTKNDKSHRQIVKNEMVNIYKQSVTRDFQGGNNKVLIFDQTSIVTKL